MKHPFVCSECREIVEWRGNRFEGRYEIRSIDRQESLHSETLHKLCKSCAVERMKSRKRITGEQGVLL